jgi:hypothetical protein
MPPSRGGRVAAAASTSARQAALVWSNGSQRPREASPRGLRQASSASARRIPPANGQARPPRAVGESSVLGNVLSGAAEEVGHKASSLAKGAIDHPLQTLQSATPLGAGTRARHRSHLLVDAHHRDRDGLRHGRVRRRIAEAVRKALGQPRRARPDVAPFAKGGKTGKGSSSDPLGIADDVKIDFASDPDFGLKPRFDVPESATQPALLTPIGSRSERQLRSHLALERLTKKSQAPLGAAIRAPATTIHMGASLGKPTIRLTVDPTTRSPTTTDAIRSPARDFAIRRRGHEPGQGGSGATFVASSVEVIER